MKTILTLLTAVWLAAPASGAVLFSMEDDSALGSLAVLVQDKAAQAAPPEPKRVALPTVKEERDRLIVMASLSHAFLELRGRPKDGHPIVAILAWGVDDPKKTPTFVVERNRNLAKRGGIYHAETNVLHKAHEELAAKDDKDAKRDDLERDELFKLVAERMKDATLYTTLEPCPMCAVTIGMAKVPRTVYATEDPALRDLATRKLLPTNPDQVFGKPLKHELAVSPEAQAANKALWEYIEKGESRERYLSGKDGQKHFRTTQYLAERGEEFFKPAFEALSAYKAKNPENQELHVQLMLSLQEPALFAYKPSTICYANPRPVKR